MLVSVFSGTASFRDTGSVQVFTFYRPATNSPATAEKTISNAAKTPGSGCRLNGGITAVDASEYNVHNGKWLQAQYDVPDASLIKVFIKKKEHGNFGYHYYQLMLRMREHAALNRLEIPLIQHENASVVELAMEGRFDCIGPDDFEAWGIDVPRRWINQFVVDEFNAEFVKLNEVEPEISPLVKPVYRTIVTDTGAARRLAVSRRRLLTVPKRST
jgi:hypothetical protein